MLILLAKYADWFVPVLGGVLSLWLLIAIIRVYNNCKKLEILLDELLANSESTRIKLNNVYAELYKLLGKYSIHESDILKYISAGQSNMQLLATQYPQLKADVIFQNASNSWSTLYDELQNCMVIYNQIVTEYNTYVTNFPRVIVCRLIGRKIRKHGKIM
jgi:hypothetical protein